MKAPQFNTSSKSNQIIITLDQATGPVQIPMTNDYLFRALLQKNNHVLKGLICALLHLKPEEVISAALLIIFKKERIISM